MKQKLPLYKHLLPVISITALIILFSCALPAVHAETQQHSSTGNTLSLQSVRDTQLPDYYQMTSSSSVGSTPIPPRAYWITPIYQAATFARGTWTLSVTVNVTVTPSIDIYTLAVLSSTGAWVRNIGEVVSRRYNAVGTYHDSVVFSSPAEKLANQRLELFYIVPNWCTSAPVITGANTYMSLPPKQ